MIKAIGKVQFWSIEGNKIYKDPNVPFCFRWLFNTYLELRSCAGGSITWTEIESYATIRKIDFTQNEIDYLLLINSWANSKISEMREEE